MKTKHFKSRHALLMSLTSLTLCVSMLFGATFAWFTDSVTSGVNRIVSGNLDVELQYKDGNDWKDAANAEAIFSDVTTGAILTDSLWEPGHTEVAYLRLRNAGTLALKYHLDIYVANEKAATNVAGQSFKLSDYIYYGITDAAAGQTTYTSADRAVAAAKATSLISANNVAANGDLLANTAPEAGWQYINLVAFMPESVDNAANYRGTAPEIGLGVLLQATQKENESDSFGTDYDRTVDDFASRPEMEFTASATTVVTKGEDNKVTDPAIITTTNAVANVPVGAVLNADANELTLTVEKKNEANATAASNFTMASDNQVGQYFEIKVDGLASNNDQLVSVALNVGEGLADLKVYHNSTELPATSANETSNGEYYTYSGSTLTLYVKSFSPFSVLYEKPIDWYTVPTEMPSTLSITPSADATTHGIITVNSADDLVYLSKLNADWDTLYSNNNKTDSKYYDNSKNAFTYSAFATQDGGKGADYYYKWTWGIKLGADIDFAGRAIAPINIVGFGDFDGQGHTIKNVKVIADPTCKSEAGLFESSNNAFSSLKLDSVQVTGSLVGNSTAGVLAGSASKDITGIEVKNSSVYGGKYSGIIVGYIYGSVTNCTAENCTVSGGYKLGGIVGYICSSSGDKNVTGNSLTGCTVQGATDKDGNNLYADGKTKYVMGKVVGNYNCDGACNNNTITNMTTNASENIGEIESGKTVNQ